MDDWSERENLKKKRGWPRMKGQLEREWSKQEVIWQGKNNLVKEVMVKKKKKD